MNKYSFKKLIRKDLARHWFFVNKGNKVSFINKFLLFFINPILIFMVVYRLAYISQRNRWPIVRLPIRITYLLFTVLYGNQISLRAEIGGGLLLVHWGGIVINGQALIGENCTMMHNVTVGFHQDKAPLIGNDCYFGTGCVVIGDIVLGDRCKIGANAVVNKNFRSDVSIGGVPAKVLED